MLPKNFIRKYPNNTAVLEVFTDYHWMFKTQPPYKHKQTYHVGERDFPFKTPLTRAMLREGLEYFDKHGQNNSYWCEKNEISNLKELQRLIELSDRGRLK